VVITFADITERRRAGDALESARLEAQQANIAKSRFLAAASHDLRQPLQALSLMHGVLARNIQDDKKEEALTLVTRLDETAAAMSGMLNTLLDINQLEAGTVHPLFVNFRISDLLDRLRDEFKYYAAAQKLQMRVVGCSQSVYSDPRLLEQMLRNLLSNALKYTRRGKILLGCRRHGGMLSIEVWDTGIGIAKQDLRAIFGEYHQLGNTARERSLGLGLGLSIVQRLATLLGHPVLVRSQPDKGSVFSIDVMLSPNGTRHIGQRPTAERGQTVDAAHRTGVILVIEDDRELRELLEMVLNEEGHHPVTVPDGPTALEMLTRDGFRPDLILADYNLPNGMDGLLVAAEIRETLHRHIPVIVLTGDISTDTLQRIGGEDCVRLNKPVKGLDIMQAIQRLLPISQSVTHSSAAHQYEPVRPVQAPVIFVVDDDSHVREGIRSLLETEGRTVEDFDSCESFLEAYRPGRGACLLVDGYLPGMTGLELLQRLQARGDRLPAIMITGNSDVPLAVQAMKAGASDFIEKPVGRDELLAGVERALEQSRDTANLSAWQRDASERVGKLTSRQRQIMDMVLAGHPSKNIAADLNLSQRTVENHRASIMKKMGAKSLPALARLALAAASGAENSTRA
jgi:two-component system, chemotaxis family, CheB/CheR fusion protein